MTNAKDIQEILTDPVAAIAPDKADGLTDIERYAARQASLGYTYSEAAEQAGVKPNVMKARLNRAASKLGIPYGELPKHLIRVIRETAFDGKTA